MNILILGSGIVGANLAKKLSEQGKNVFLLEIMEKNLNGNQFILFFPEISG